MRTLNKYVNDYNIILIDDDTLNYELQAYDKYGREYDFTNKTAEMKVKNDRGITINMLSTIDDSIILNYNNINGKILLNKKGFNKVGVFYYDLRVVDGINIYTIMSGKFIVEKNITDIDE